MSKDKAELGKAAGESEEKAKKHRSPNYPVIGLRKALDLARVMYDAFKRSQVPIGVLHQKWTYKPHSGVGNQMVAALKAYGLINIEGSGDLRKIKISEECFKILENHSEREKLLKVAALSPSIYRDIWDTCAKDNPPVEEIVEHHLKFDLNFNTAYIDSVTGDFLDTISFAKVVPGDIINPVGSSEKLNRTPVSDPKDVSGVKLLPVTPLPPGGTNMATETIDLDEGTVTVQAPRALSITSVMDLKDWLNLLIRKMERRVKTEVPLPTSDQNQ